jgi:hypothetical protein
VYNRFIFMLLPFLYDNHPAGERKRVYSRPDHSGLTRCCGWLVVGVRKREKDNIRRPRLDVSSVYYKKHTVIGLDSPLFLYTHRKKKKIDKA